MAVRYVFRWTSLARGTALRDDRASCMTLSMLWQGCHDLALCVRHATTMWHSSSGLLVCDRDEFNPHYSCAV